MDLIRAFTALFIPNTVDFKLIMFKKGVMYGYYTVFVHKTVETFVNATVTSV